MNGTTGDAVTWLLSSAEPAVRLLVRRDLLGQDVAGTGEVLDAAMVRTLLSGQCRDGGLGVHPYRKWTGAHWRLVSLVELGIPPGELRAVRAAGTVLGWLTGREHRSRVVMTGGLARAHASHEGNALAVCSRLGLGRDLRAELLAEPLARWQWPDGGWNCDRRATGLRSSFHESLAPAWGLFEYWRATGEPAAREAALRTAELFLEHRLFRSLHTGQVIRRDWLTCTTPRTGTTPSSRCCSCSPGRGLPMTGAAATPSSCWNAADGRTAAGGQAALAETARYATRHGGGRRPGPIRAQRDDHAQRAADTRDRTAISESEEPGILKSSISIPATAARPGHATG